MTYVPSGFRPAPSRGPSSTQRSRAPAVRRAVPAGLAVLLLGGPGASAAQTFSPQQTPAQQELQVLPAEPPNRTGVEAPPYSDLWVRARLLTTFSLNEYLHAFDIGVGVTDDTVTLTGTVDSPAARDLAGRLARDLSGIAAVDNQLRVVPGLEPAPRLNPYYRMVQQANLATRVRLQLIWRDSIGGLLVDVTTRGDTVILAGKVRSQAAKERAGRIALRTAGVAAVDNQLEVDPDAEVAETVGPAMASAGATVPDGWISARVKGALRFDRTVDADRIDVSAENGVVTLSGQVPSAGQKRAAAAIAAEIEGVQSVDNALSVDEAA